MKHKYKVGDRVRIVDHRAGIMATDGGMDHWFGKIMTIRCYDGTNYRMVEDKEEYLGSGWYWNDECIDGLANESEPWTDDEIEKARGIVAYLADGIVYGGGDLRFIPNGDLISAAVWTDSFDYGTQKSGTAKPYGEDVYNPWIGKCVALCKSMDEPIPDFIMNKNRR